MKTSLAALFALLPVAAGAVEAPLSFPDAQIEAPPLSLVENSLQAVPSPFRDFRAANRPAADRVVVDPGMPIVAPKDCIDQKMVKAPDPSVDYKLIVKSPDADPVR